MTGSASAEKSGDRPLLLRGARPLGGLRRDVLVSGGLIAAIGAEVGRHVDRHRAWLIEAEDLVLLPGLVDLHTHLREPGDEGSETIESATRSAAAGGFTAVHAMANTVPSTDTPALAEALARAAANRGVIDVAVVGAVTRDRRGEELVDIGAMAASNARVRVFSDDGSCVADPLLMRRALQASAAQGTVIAQHAEEPRLTAGAQVNEPRAAPGLLGWPPVAEEIIVARDCILARDLGARLHVCHLSTAGALEVVRWAKAHGAPVTAEVTPHHLLLTDEMVATGDPLYKVNPPLRSGDDVMALRTGLEDGTIDAVATDHAPHPAVRKSCSWSDASPGMLGLERALAVIVATMVEPERLDWAEVADRMSTRPATIGGLRRHGRPIAPGEPANLVLVDPAVRWVAEPGGTYSLSRNDPYVGRNLRGVVMATLLGGRVVHLAPEALERGWTTPGSGRPVREPNAAGSSLVAAADASPDVSRRS